MSAMQQIYATHCTFGTSAIERREGEMSERVLGYSARSSSFSQADLRKHFRTFERYLSYNLWSDSPAELRTTLVAATAPKRMVFMPSVSGFQMLGQVAYRTWDTTGKRAGSYFAHLLVAERAKDEAPWSILDCLRLWGAPGWQVEDSPTFAYDLPPLANLQGLWTAPPERAFEDPFEPVIGDDFLLRFLTQDDLAAGPGGNFLPTRWVAMPAQRRFELFRQALRGYLHIAAQGRDNAVLVAEPEVAALFFYGIARLLPEGELRHAISFSTFEGNVDRPATQLIGTHFHDPYKTDLRPDRYLRGFSLNTFLDGKSTDLRTPHPYADLILGRLTTDGWRAVDEVFAAFQAGLGKTVADLGELVRAGDLAERFLDPAATLDTASMDRNEFARRYVGKSLSTTLAGPAQETLLRPLIDAPDQRAIVLLKLLAGGPHAAACESSLRYLREHLPESQLPRFLELSEIPVELKIRTLVKFVDREQRLPAGCEDLFDIAQGAARSARDQQLAPLAAPLLRELRSETVRAIADTVPAAAQPAFFAELAVAVGPADDKQKWLRRMAVKGGNMSDESLSLAVERLGERLDLLMPEIRKEIGYRFVQVLNSIQRVPADFSTKLTQIRRVSRLIEALEDIQRDPGDLGPSWAPIDRLNAWARVPEIIKQARLSSQEKKTGWAALRAEGPSDLQFRVGKQLAEALSRALPHTELRPESSSQDKAVMMHNIIMALGGGDLVGPDWKTRAAYYLEYSHWYDTAAPVGRKSEASRRPLLFFGIGAGVATLLGTLFLLFMFSGDSRLPAPTKGKVQVAQSTTKPGATTRKTVKQSAVDGTKKESANTSKPTKDDSEASKAALPSKADSPAADEQPAAKTKSDSAASAASAKPAIKELDAKLDGDAKPTGASESQSPAASKPAAPETPAAKPTLTAPPPATTPNPAAKPTEPPAPAESPEATPAERDFEVAELPLPAPEAIKELLSDLPRPLGESGNGPAIRWVLWRDEPFKGYEHLRIHGLKLAKSPWQKVLVNLVPIADRYVLRATHGEDIQTDLLELNMSPSTGVLTLTVPSLDPSLKELGEIQRQLFFCVLEIKSAGVSRYVALHPPSAARDISMLKDDKSSGLIQRKGWDGSLANLPEEQRLQRLHVARGGLWTINGQLYSFGAEKSDWLGAEEDERSLRPKTMEIPETECRIKYTQRLGSDARLTIVMPQLERDAELTKEINNIEQIRDRIVALRRTILAARNNVGLLDSNPGQKLDQPVADLAKLCDYEEFLFPKRTDYPEPRNGKPKDGKTDYEVAIEAYYAKLEELAGKPGNAPRKDACDAKLKDLEMQLNARKKERDAIRGPRQKILEQFQANAAKVRVELYRVVPREPQEPQEPPRLIRVPTVVHLRN